MTGEFPKIEISTREKREIMEREFPEVLRIAGEHYSRHRIQELQSQYSQIRDPKLYNEIFALGDLNWKDISKNLLKPWRSPADPKRLEILALLDAEIGNLEDKIAEMELKKSEREEGEGSEALLKEYEDLIKNWEGQRDRLAAYKSWLVEEVPALREFYTQKDFNVWLEAALKRAQELMRNAKNRGDEKEFAMAKKNYLTLEAALIGRALKPDEAYLLLQIMEVEIKIKRSKAASLFFDYLLGRQYNPEALLETEKEIIKLTQFKSNLEAGEWIRLPRKK